jgi:hypothetical protein
MHCAPLAHSLGVLLLDDLFKYVLAIFMFKVKNNMAPCVISQLFIELMSIHEHETRSLTSRFFVPRCTKLSDYVLLFIKVLVCGTHYLVMLLIYV